MKYTLYEVGGAVRDRLLGVKNPKDIDYSVVIHDAWLYESPEDAFNRFVKAIGENGFEIFLKTPGCLTVRAKFPKDHPNAGMVADFVLARKEIEYPWDSRRPITTLGSLEDDLKRRDFTVNAIAQSIEEQLIDPLSGIKHLKQGILKTCNDAGISFNEDPLRILRALRFQITKGLELSSDIIYSIKTYNLDRFYLVSSERVREELQKMFTFSTIKTLNQIQALKDLNPSLYENIFVERQIWLMPTNKNAK